MRERIFVNRGHEHEAFKARMDEQIVLKKPRPLALFGVRLHGGADVIRKELHDAYKSVEETGVNIPETRVFTFPRGYIIAQRYIPEDGSVPIGEYLAKHGTKRLEHRFRSTPANFIASEKKVYLIDTTSGAFERILLAGGYLNREMVETAKDKIGAGIFYMKEKIKGLPKINSLRGSR